MVAAALSISLVPAAILVAAVLLGRVAWQRARSRHHHPSMQRHPQHVRVLREPYDWERQGD